MSSSGVNMSNLARVHSVGVLSNLNDLRTQNDLCDVTLHVGSSQLSAHKVVLSASSPYFKAMFTQDMAERNQSYVTFQCISMDAMQLLIDFAYTGNLEVTISNVQNLLSAACLLQMNLVVDECCQFLESQAHVNNCVGIWRFSDTYGLVDLQQVMWKFITQNFEDISKYEEICELPVQDLVKILTCDDLNVSSEELVFKTLESWLLWDLKRRKRFLPQLLKCIRIPLLGTSFLRNGSKLIDLIFDDTVAKDILYSSLQLKIMQQRGSLVDSDLLRPRCAPKALCAVGGKNGLFAILASFEMYIPQRDEWQPMTPLPRSRYECGVVVTDRKLYVLGGIVCEPYRQHSNTVAVWDSEKNVWGWAAHMSRRRSSFGSVVVKGDIYALGGYDGETYLRHVEKFTPRKQCWERVPDMLQTRTCFAAAALHDNIYAIGGYGPTHHDSVEVYHTVSLQWQQISPMLNKRINFGVAVLNNSLYVMGGHSGHSHLSSMERYDLINKEWTLCDPMPKRRTGIGTAVIDGKLYVAGGHSGQEYLREVYCYDPATKMWEMRNGMTSARCGFGLTAL